VHKLPVFATAGLAYQFLLREAGTILRLSWFPLLIVTIIQYFAMRAQFTAMRSAFESGNVGAVNMNFPVWQWQIANIVVALLGSAIVAVALHRVILLGDRKPGRFLYVALGKVELLFALLPIILMVPIIVVSFLAFGLGIMLLPKSASWVAFVGLFLMWLGAVFVLVRLALVLPIAVLEGRYKFGQSWSLTRGNFWRLVGLWLVVLIPLLIILAIFSALTSPFAGIETAASKKSISALFEQLDSFLVVQSIFGFVWAIVVGALGVAVLSYSYKALSGLPPDAVWTPET
jgi:hypothetical protein